MGVKYIWYDKMYYGESIVKRKLRTKMKLSAGREGFDTYLLTIPEGDENMLDIIRSIELKQPIYSGRKKYVVGIAKGRTEAIELVKAIIEEAYQNTGKIDLRDYLSFEKTSLEVD